MNSLFFKKGSRLRAIFIFTLFFLSIASFLPINNAHAAGEQYKWLNRNSIEATGGNFSDTTYRFTRSAFNTKNSQGQPVAVSRENGFVLETTESTSGFPGPIGQDCVLRIGIEVNANDHSKAIIRRNIDAELVALTATPPPCDLPGMVSVSPFSTPANISNSNLSNTDEQVRDIKVSITTVVKADEAYSSDKITLKVVGSNKVLGQKNVTKKEIYTDGDFKGFRVDIKFKNTEIGRTDQIEACSQYIGKCTALIEDRRTLDNTGLAAVTINKVYEPSSDGTTCAVEGVGWIVCPVVKFLGIITDNMYDILANNLLVVNAGEIFNTSGNAYKAWSTMRNLANVAFVVAFLFIIYSQITGVGLSNYGVKRMLPKIIIAAILVNTSFWICAAAVDVSNILGFSIKELFDSSTGNGFQFTITDGGITKEGNGWTGLAVAILATAALVYVGLSVLLPALVVVALAVITVVAVLAARQALVILLIVISPLAFVAYLLPNTEEWFKKWFSLFKTLLLVFPIIGAVFGASALASKVVMGAAQGNVVVSVVGALITVVPLFITPIIMKSAGGVLNRIGGVINNPNKGPFDRMKKGADKVRENSRVSRGLRAMDPNKKSFPGRRGFINYRNKRNAINAGRTEQFSDLQKEDMAHLAVDNAGFAKKVAGNRSELYQQKQEAYLASVNPDKLMLDLDKSKISNMVGELTLSVKDPANKISEMKRVLEKEGQSGGDAIKARAAQEILMNSGNAGTNALREALSSVDRSSEVGIDLRKDIAASNLKGKAADVYKWSVDDQGRSLETISRDAGTWSGLADAQLAGQVEGAMRAAVGSGGITPEKAKSTLSSRGSEAIGEAEAKVLRDHAGL